MGTRAADAGGMVFLKPEVKLEPLLCGWYAWTHLISPVQHAMNVTYRQLPLLQSFVTNPAIHFAASKDPSLFAGPFVDLERDQLNDAKALLADMQRRCAMLIRMAKDIREQDTQLQNGAKGYSLSDFYRGLPETLAGLVEFNYDINNHPRLRFYEELIYDEHERDGLSQIMLSRVEERNRTFFMSTPRLKKNGDVLLQLPFSSEKLDMLSASRTEPQSLDEMSAALGVSKEGRPTFECLFTTEAPTRAHSSSAGEVRVRYFGHACVLLQAGGVSILVDPMVAFEEAHEDNRFVYADLPNHIDYVVLSHNHQDHCAPEILLQLRHRIGQILVPSCNAGNICDPSIELALHYLGFRNVRSMRAFDVVEFRVGRITSLPFPGEHVDLDIHSRHGIYIEIAGRRFSFLVDSDGSDPLLFRRIARRIGRELDALFIGMECHGAPLTWLYGPLLTRPISRRDDESRRLSGLDSQRAWNILQEFDSRKIFVYAMGQEPWLRYIMGLEYTPDSVQLKEMEALLARCHEAGREAEYLYVSRDMQF